jgi:putative RNA 2'-phosphotransferase
MEEGEMLKDCRSHGFFRGETCPSCGDKAKFLLNDKEVGMLGKTLAGILRHFPSRYSLEIDTHGWIDLSDLVTAIKVRHSKFRFLKPHHIMALIQTDPKGRYQFQEGKVRATYGHSLDLELDLPTDDIPEILYYPATVEERDILLESGLKPADRKMVHLSGTMESAREAGEVRTANPIILKVDAKTAIGEGTVIYKAGKTVYTTKGVPSDFLSVSEE